MKEKVIISRPSQKYEHLDKEISRFKNNHRFPFDIEHSKSNNASFKKYRLNMNLIEDEKMICEKRCSLIFHTLRIYTFHFTAHDIHV